MLSIKVSLLECGFAILLLLISTVAADVSVVGKSTEEILADHQYEYESLVVQTRDGYLLNLVRVINPLIIPTQLKRPVLLNHGLMESSILFVYNSDDIRPRNYSNDPLLAIGDDELLSEFLGPDTKSLPMMLANAGYDVYLLNMRGNEFSQRHIQLTPENPLFWDFTADDLALIDIPDTLNFIQKRTNATKIAYAAHSLGTFTILGLLAEEPQYADLVEPIFLLAPVTTLSHEYSISRGLFQTMSSLSPIAQAQQVHGPVPLGASELRESMGELCYRQLNPVQVTACRGILHTIAGIGEPDSSTETILVAQNFQSSSRVLAHLGQSTLTRRWQKFDYGFGNLAKYGSMIPPEYNIGAIRSHSLVFFCGTTDSLTPPNDIRIFISRLKVKPLQVTYINMYNHFDVLGAKSAGKNVMIPILRTLESFTALSSTVLISIKIETRQ